MAVHLLRMEAECIADAKRSATPPVERIVSMSAISHFLSYIAFAHGAHGADSTGDDCTAVCVLTMTNHIAWGSY